MKSMGNVSNLIHGKLPRNLPASVTQLDAYPTGDQEVAGSTPLGPPTFFHGDWSWNIFYSHSFSSAESRRSFVSFWQKNVHKY